MEWVLVSQGTAGRTGASLVKSNSPLSGAAGSDLYSWVYHATGSAYFNNTTIALSTGALALGDLVMYAFDVDTGSFWMGKNGTWANSGNPTTGANPLYTGLTADAFFFGGWAYNTSDVVAMNFGQRPFAYTPPTGFKSLNTYNLPDSTVEDGSEYFNTVTYSGTGSSLSIPVGFIPDFTWIKRRNAANNHQAFDVLRGSNVLVPNETGAESDYSLYFDFSSSDGFDLPNASVNMNNSSGTYVAWNWKANGSGVSNTDGSITSTVSANTTAGFSISTFTTPSSFTNATVGHGLGVAPSMLIVKRRTTGDWITWHQSLGANGYLTLNTTSASASNSGSFNGTSSTTWTMGSSAWWQASASDWVCYAFADVDGYSKFGSYTGNASANGPFVYTGFRPAFVLLKVTNTTANWVIIDTQRNEYNAAGKWLLPDSAAAEYNYDALYPIDFLSNGFKLRTSVGTLNLSAGNYIYAAFAENPFKNALAR
jgi:hypothetical protein